MSQTLAQERIEIMIDEAKKVLKQYGLNGTTSLMNKAAVTALCGPPIEQRRISTAKQIETVTTSTGRYPYVVFAFRSPQNRVLCIPDANYYIADGLYDVHAIDCAGKEVLCAEVALNLSDIFGIPLQKEALLLLADERTLCERHLLPLSTCVGERGEGAEEEEEEEEKPERGGGERVSTAVNRFRAELAAAAATAAATARSAGQPSQPPLQPSQPSSSQLPPQPPPPPPDPKAVLKEVGLGWLAPILDDPAAAAALRFVLSNKDVLNALKDEEKRKIVVQALKEGGVPAAPPELNKALEKWVPRDRERLLKILSSVRGLYELATVLLQYLTGRESCTYEVVQTILDRVAERCGITCEAVAQALSQ